MPTAALADVHGNLHALDAVLADPRLIEADRIVVLGDVVTGTFPAETLDRLTALPGSLTLLASGQPNAEEVAETLLRPPAPEEATAWWEESRVPR